MAQFPSTNAVKSYLRNDKPTDDDIPTSEALAAAIQTMCDECQHNFAIAGTATARTFPPDPHSDVLRVGDFTTLTSVVENGVTLTVGTHHQPEPVNRVNFAGLVVPYSTIRRLGTTWYTNGPRGTVVVTAAWGWVDIPVRVVESVKILTKDILENRDARGGLLTFAEAGLATARLNPYVIATIGSYRGRESWGVA